MSLADAMRRSSEPFCGSGDCLQRELLTYFVVPGGIVIILLMPLYDPLSCYEVSSIDKEHNDPFYLYTAYLYHTPSVTGSYSSDSYTSFKIKIKKVENMVIKY